MTSRTRLTRLPSSGDILADWLFRQFVCMLRKETLLIMRKRRLTDPSDRHRRVIRGLMDPQVHPSGKFIHIFINPAKDANRDWHQEVETLIHELAHIVMPGVSERHILQLEKRLAKRLTLEQRQYLRTFLPRHVVKRYPTASSLERNLSPDLIAML